MTATVDGLLDLLDVRPEGDEVFTGTPSGSVLPRVFGGQVIGQALAAAGATVDPHRRPHSLHAYFLRAGSSAEPIQYVVSTLREGRSFSTREVRASQGAGPIFTMTASFHEAEPGLDHQVPAPSAPPPETLPRIADRPEAWPDIYREWSSVDIRHVKDDRAHQYGSRSWMRVTSPLPDDPLLHACILACISDLTLLSVTLVPHAIPPRHEDHLVASLDHSVWFHRDCRVDDWLLYDQTTPSMSDSLGLAHGRILTADGTLVASVAQEGLVRAVSAERTSEPRRAGRPRR
jgi:acyl-CoA thioesterase-2